MTALRVLIAEDNPDDADLACRELTRWGFALDRRVVETRAGMESALDGPPWDIIISDHVMPQFSSLGVLDVLKARGITTPVIVVSGKIGEEAAVSIIRAGAEDYVSKDHLALLPQAVERALRAVAEHQKRLEAEQELREREALERKLEVERLREMAEYKSHLLSMVAHEVNTPMTVLILNLDLLKAALPPDKRYAANLEALDRGVTRLARLVTDVLQVSRLQAGRMVLRLQPCDLAPLVQAAAAPFADAAAKADVTLEVVTKGPLEVDADADRVTQVITNFLSNALKFTSPRGRIQVEATTDGEEAVVHVEDTGIGLGPEMLSKMFTPFVMVDDPARNPGGTGLGMSISKGILEAHGGRIWVESEGPGKGSTFSFALPLVSAGQPATAQPAPAPTLSA